MDWLALVRLDCTNLLAALHGTAVSALGFEVGMMREHSLHPLIHRANYGVDGIAEMRAHRIGKGAQLVDGAAHRVKTDASKYMGESMAVEERVN